MNEVTPRRPVRNQPKTEEIRRIDARHLAFFLPREPAQEAYRRAISTLDDAALMELESDIRHYLEFGEMSRHLGDLLSIGTAA